MNGATQLPLRDIHLPEPVSWWPPGPGWWLLAVLIIALVMTGMWLWTRYKQAAGKRFAQQELSRIAKEFDEFCDRQRLAKDLSALLRRASISYYPRHEVAALTGAEWLNWLDQHADCDEFSQGPGTALLSAPYQAKPEYDSAALLALCRRCLQKLPHQLRLTT